MKKCKKCGKEIQGGCYNTPEGIYCCECWEKIPKRGKKRLEHEALLRYAQVGRIIRI